MMTTTKHDPRWRLPEARVLRYLQTYLISAAAGEPLPSVRELLKRCRVGPQTVQVVTQRLAARKQLDVRPGSGLFRGDAEFHPGAFELVVISFEPGGGLPRPYFRGALLEEIDDLLQRNEIPNTVNVLGDDATMVDVQAIVKQKPEAVFLLIGIPHTGIQRLFRENQLPHISLLPAALDLPARVIDIVPETVIELQMDHLWQTGHRRIGYLHNIAGGTAHRDFILRREAYFRYLALHSLPLQEAWVQFAGYDHGKTRQAVAALMGCVERPDALIISDHHAPAVFAALDDLGLACPDDLNIVGTDDLPAALAVTPALTTVQVSRERLAQLALDNLMAQHWAQACPERLSLKPVLIERGSTG